MGFAVPVSIGAKTVVRHRVPSEKPAQTIVVFVNGTRLSLVETPEIVAGRLYLPLRPILSALGIPLIIDQGMMMASLPTGAFAIRTSSGQATLDGEPIPFSGRPFDRQGVTYIPYALISRAFAGAVSFDQHVGTVEIVSPYFVGAPPPGGSAVTGTVAAIDRVSRVPELTVMTGGNPRSIALTTGAKYWLEDVSIRTQVPATLAGIVVGDAVHVILAKNGSVLSVHDFFKSASGSLAAVSPQAVALADGRLVVPKKTTLITLDDVPAGLGALMVGDFVTIRSNPQTGDLRQIVASRAVSSAAPSNAQPSDIHAATSAAEISGVTISAIRPLRAGETLSVDVNGTPGGRASFDIGDYLEDLPLREERPGLYRGRFVIPERFNLAEVPVYAHLVVGEVSAPRAQARQRLTTLTTTPLIGDFAPRPQASVNDRRPTIYATFSSPAEDGIDTRSVRLNLDGHDVSGDATCTSSYVIYMPTHDLPDGPRRVTLRLQDKAGNISERSWIFTIAPTQRAMQ
jgi:hypothetical protein